MSLVNSREIDWDGNCIFENGKVVRFRHQDQRNSFSMRPIPQNEDTQKMARNALLTLDNALKPATTDEIALSVKKLSLHCGMQDKSPLDVKFMFMDYCVDLKDYPIGLIDEACKSYRQQSSGNEFMPSSGKLISMMESKYYKMIFLKKRVEKILGIDEVKKLPLSLWEEIDQVVR